MQHIHGILIIIRNNNKINAITLHVTCEVINSGLVHYSLFIYVYNLYAVVGVAALRDVFLQNGNL